MLEKKYYDGMQIHDVICECIDDYDTIMAIMEKFASLPSVEPDIKYRKQGEWEMFELITSAWYGKQCYSMEDNGIVYSRMSCKHMTVHDAILEFLRSIGDE